MRRALKLFLPFKSRNWLPVLINDCTVSARRLRKEMSKAGDGFILDTGSIIFS